MIRRREFITLLGGAAALPMAARAQAAKVYRVGMLLPRAGAGERESLASSAGAMGEGAKRRRGACRRRKESGDEVGPVQCHALRFGAGAGRRGRHHDHGDGGQGDRAWREGSNLWS